MQLGTRLLWRRVLGYQPYLVAGLGIFAIAMGAMGFRALPPPVGPLSWDNAIYCTFGLAVLDWPLDFNYQVPLSLNVARFLAPALTGYAVVRAGLLILSGFHEKLRRRRFRRHVIICGLGQRGRHIAVRRAGAGEDVLAIDPAPSADIPTVCENRGLGFVQGSAADAAVLVEAGISRAAEVFILTGDDNLNLEIIHSIRTVRQSLGSDQYLPPLECYLNISDLYLSELIPTHADFLEQSSRMQIYPFNEFEKIAQNLWSALLQTASENKQCLPLARNELRCAHFVLIGFGQAGKAIALQTALQGHFLNGLPTRLTIIDPNVGASSDKDEQDVFFTSLDLISSVLLVKRVCARPGSAKARVAILEAARASDSLTTILVSGADDSANLQLALRENQHVRNAGCRKVPVFVRLSESAGLHEFLAREKRNDEVLVNVHGFGLYQDTFSVASIRSVRTDAFARAIHETFLQSYAGPTDSAADDDWERLPEYVKYANRTAAQHMELKCLSIGCELSAGEPPTESLIADELEALCRMEHNRWMSEKILQGWEHDGKTSRSNMTHKNLCGWDELPESEQSKTKDLIKKIPAMLQSIQTIG